jgi:HlyD family secretion protein
MEARRAKRPVSPGRVWIVGRDEELTPVDIMTGISDGNFSEIVRGDLKTGQEVIIGTKQSGRRSSSGGRRRFGF